MADVAALQNLAEQLIREVTEYVGAGIYNEQTNASMRKLQLIVGTLNTALQGATLIAPLTAAAPPTMPPPPTITSHTDPHE